ncbi:FHA domain-containing protein, partial [bacterium]|nr:FHA domain-containing protein [bacterium]
MTTLTQTSTYSGRFTWTIHDEVIRLRQWATDTVYELPKVSEDRSSECTVGAGRGCQIQLDDRWASRHHALLSYEEGFWNVADLDSRNGVKIDGVRLRKARLEPGMEVRIGRTTLVAESLRSIGLRCYLGRILGWSERQRETVDAAM